MLRDQENECEKDSDCACSTSKCNIKDGESEGRCAAQYANAPACFAECISEELGTTMTRYLKESWGLGQNSTISEFNDMFVDSMTAPTCLGDRMWEEDIG